MKNSSDNLLFITRYFPYPGHAGAWLWSAMLIKIFAEKFESVSVICFENPNCKAELDKNLSHFDFPPNISFHIAASKSLNILNRALSVLPNAALSHDSSSARLLLRELMLDHPSNIVIDHIGSSWAYRVINSAQVKYPDNKLIYCTHNYEVGARLSIAKMLIKKPWKALPHFIDAIKIKLVEMRLVSCCGLILTSASQDKNLILRKYSSASVRAILPVYSQEVVKDRSISKDTPRKVLLVGSFIWSAKKIDLENLLAESVEILKSSNIGMVVVGNMDEKYREYLKKRWPSIEVTGRVASVSPYLSRSRIALLPEVAGNGFQWKALEYIFSRLPIFTIKGGITDIPVSARDDVVVARNQKELVRLVIKYIDDYELLNTLHEKAILKCSSFLSIADRKKQVGEALNSIS